MQNDQLNIIMVGTFSQVIREHVANGGFLHCRDIHDHSCEWEAFARFMAIVKLSYKFYLPIHLIPTLIFKRHKLKSHPVDVLKSFLKGYIKSILMLSTYVTLFRYFLCFLKNRRHTMDRWNAIIAGMIAPFFSIWFEPAGRRAELTLYLIPRFAEAFYNWLVKHGVARYIKNGEVIIFAIAMAVICYCYQNEDDCIKPTYKGVFKKFYGEN